MKVCRKRLAWLGLTTTLLGMAVLEVALWTFFLPTTLRARAFMIAAGVVLVGTGLAALAAGKSSTSSSS